MRERQARGIDLDGRGKARGAARHHCPPHPMTDRTQSQMTPPTALVAPQSAPRLCNVSVTHGCGHASMGGRPGLAHPRSVSLTGVMSP